jgi:uncharacterized Fe-S center protein
MGEKDRLSKVYYFKDPRRVEDALNNFGLEKYSGEEALLKLHMGEKNNKYFTKPEFVRLIVNSLLNVSSKPFLYDTTVFYNSKRNNIKGYEEVAKTHGFTKNNIGCEVIIDDAGKEVVIEDNSYIVGNKMFFAENIIGISHFKGHIASGMGGSIKNFGMGGVTKETKRFMHNSCKPSFNERECKYCGICVEVCPFDAIKVENNKWILDNESCFGCGVCTENCEFGALNYINNDLSYFLACSTKACVENKNVIYVNDVNRISKSCDCDPSSGPIICPDIGYFVSDDPVAIDKASIDLIYEKKPNVFEKLNRANPFKQIKYGEKIGLGSSSYDLIEL